MRIASLLPSATEIVCALGLEESLVAVTHECDYPESVKTKPIVTHSVLDGKGDSAQIDRHIRELVHQGSSIYTLDAQRLATLHPDVVLTQELCDVCAVSYPVVEQAARRSSTPMQLVSLEPQQLADVFDHIRLVGRLADRQAQAERVVADLEGRLREVQDRVRREPVRPIVILEWIDPPFNAGHWTPGLVQMAGGRDLLGIPGRPAHPIEWTAVIAACPEIVVVSACGLSLERSMAEAETALSRFGSPADEIWVVDGNAFFSRPGPRLVDSVEILAGILHPAVVEPAAASVARRLR
ncbi:MAG: iron complex transport system substrate-binding protein [Chloroflexota bacterium]|nr:iron complex transport system substrate-binding protein [Chloroflexota bacterium]